MQESLDKKPSLFQCVCLGVGMGLGGGDPLSTLYSSFHHIFHQKERAAVNWLVRDWPLWEFSLTWWIAELTPQVRKGCQSLSCGTITDLQEKAPGSNWVLSSNPAVRSGAHFPEGGQESHPADSGLNVCSRQTWGWPSAGSGKGGTPVFSTSLERDSPERLGEAQISPPAVLFNPALLKTPAYQEMSILILHKAEPSTFLFISARQNLKRRGGNKQEPQTSSTNSGTGCSCRVYHIKCKKIILAYSKNLRSFIAHFSPECQTCNFHTEINGSVWHICFITSEYI